MSQTTATKKKRHDEKIPEKDEAEKKLESLLFGDDDGFQSALKNKYDLKSMALATVSDESGDEDMEDEAGRYDEDLENLADADLFFLDSGPGPVSTELDQSPATPAYSEAGENDEEENELPAVWHDSDDERLTVSLAGKDRLRKLRVTESEDIINGKEYIRRLQRQYLALHPTPDWAKPNLKKQDDEEDDDSDRAVEVDTDDEGGATTQPLAKLLQGLDFTNIESRSGPDGKRKLRPEVIGIARLKDIGKEQPSAVTSLTFHPHYPIILSSGPASTLFLHHVAPDAPAPNPLLTSFHIRKTPITTSAFTPSGTQIYASGRRRFFHIWDLNTGKVDKVNGTSDRKSEQKSMEHFKLSPCGRYIGLVGSTRKGGGVINIHNAGTSQWIAQVRVDGRGGVADFDWWKNGEGLTVVNLNGEVSEWDGRLNRVIARWKDAGGVGTTVLRLGGDSGLSELGGDRWVAIGSRSGIVNVYNRREWATAYAAHLASSKQADEVDASSSIPHNPEPVRALDQLVTPISQIVFAPDGQFFAMASEAKKDAFRLVHLPSCTVYRNWPTSTTPLGKVSSIAISPNSEYLAVGSVQGRVRLWEIRG